ncbi:MAG: STAS/SEC14 domain-containing protein [Specibacter sp.]
MTALEEDSTALPAADRRVADGDAHICDGGILVWFQASGVMRVKLPEHTDVAGKHAAAAAEVVRSLAAGRKYPILLDLTRVRSVSRHARTFYGKPEMASAYALLGEGPVDRVLAHYFLGGIPEGVPANFFESESDALQWLGSICNES